MKSRKRKEKKKKGQIYFQPVRTDFGTKFQLMVDRNSSENLSVQTEI